MSLVYEPLFAVRERGDEEPCLASAYKFENGGLTVRVMLKENVKFHSGAVFNADDVIFTLKYIAEYAPNFFVYF
ncbi:MAG: ABC transporter substrate-binding protein [Clostridiales bacterium]|nr:MAG: ABC transporter substrate-binding protein [Clostridiales bacterium]